MAVFAAKGMPIFQLRADGKGTKNTGQRSSKVICLRGMIFVIFKISNRKLTYLLYKLCYGYSFKALP